jgi:hypothetical protein
MATKEQPKGTRPMDRKSMKHTRGGIIVVCKTADAVAGPGDFSAQPGTLTVRKAGEKPLEY